ncbi:hypothetical protein I3760_11G177800 [Carya illinoinensis]|nr:hypothetical protein I3760_11G177800 [Carya illinoinensis]
MIKEAIGETEIFVFWVLAILLSLVLGMRNDGQKQQQGGVPRPGRPNGFIPSSFRAISSYLRIVSSGASTVARSAASVASSIVDRDDDANHDQVIWAGFDKLEGEGDVIRQVLLLAYRSGFQVWDVEDADNVRDLVSRHDGPVSFMQMLPKPVPTKGLQGKFGDCHPLLVVCGDGSLSIGGNIQDGSATPGNGSIPNGHDPVNGNFLPTTVRFYSIRSQSYVHVLKFRSVVYSIRCSSRVVAISQAAQVIIRDIVSKVVIAQFRAHKSPISALCFDPSGTLLVTASVQGHNINVFKIIPGLPGSSSASDAGASYVHLYRLQRGFTNAVIQDITFSDDSNWIMISSSRGTSHLFTINPLGGSVNFQSADASLTIKNSSLGVMTNPSVRWPPNQQSLFAAGPPVTLSVVSRIRNGNNGWRGTVSGAAAAATGRMSSLSGAIASSFHNCRGNALYVDCSSSKSKYHLLVFSPSGCMTQYVLRTSTCLDPTANVSGLTTGPELAPECDARLVIEAIQKWNICQKHNRREREDNIDIYGENGNSDSNKIYSKGVRKGNSIYPEAGGTFAKAKISPEEKHHFYISEAELQMHQPRAPLWAKPKIYFQLMMVEGPKRDDENASGGEIEIERIPTCVIEARSKGLVPVFDYLSTPKIQQTRNPALECNLNGRLQQQRSGLLANGRFSHRSSSGSLDSVTDSSASLAEFHNGIEETESDGPRMPVETNSFVNNNDSPKTKTRLEIVNNRESFKVEAQLKLVNSNKESVKMENHFEDEGVEFD